MINYKNLITYLLALFVGFAMIACEDDCDSETAGDEAGAEEMAAGADDEACEEEEAGDEDEAGDEVEAGDTPDAGDEAGTDATTTSYNQVIIVDTTTDINDDGTPGVDICEVDIACDGASLERVDNIDQSFGSSPSCGADNGDNCVCDGTEMRGVCTSGIDRANAELTFDGDNSCENDNWSTVGINGYLAYKAEALSECSSVDVSVTERDGNNDESYLVALCGDVDVIDFSEMMISDDCALLGSAETSGTSNFEWSE